MMIQRSKPRVSNVLNVARFGKLVIADTVELTRNTYIALSGPTVSANPLVISARRKGLLDRFSLGPQDCYGS